MHKHLGCRSFDICNNIQFMLHLTCCKWYSTSPPPKCKKIEHRKDQKDNSCRVVVLSKVVDGNTKVNNDAPNKGDKDH